MKRLLIIAIFLLLGAVVNVVVAWACSAWVHLGPDRTTAVAWQADPNLPGGRGWKLTRADAVGATRLVAMVRTTRRAGEEKHSNDVVPAWSRLPDIARRQSADAASGANVRPSVMYEDGRGWPLRALRCRWDHGVQGARLHGGIALAPAQPNPPGELNIQNQRALPLWPWWPGFVFNTLFYAAILWLLIPGPFALRRFLRVRRGLCPTCAYPSGESSVCTECGKPVPRRRRVPILT